MALRLVWILPRSDNAAISWKKFLPGAWNLRSLAQFRWLWVKPKIGAMAAYLSLTGFSRMQGRKVKLDDSESEAG